MPNDLYFILKKSYHLNDNLYPYWITISVSIFHKITFEIIQRLSLTQPTLSI